MAGMLARIGVGGHTGLEVRGDGGSTAPGDPRTSASLASSNLSRSNSSLPAVPSNRFHALGRVIVPTTFGPSEAHPPTRIAHRQIQGYIAECQPQIIYLRCTSKLGGAQETRHRLGCSCRACRGATTRPDPVAGIWPPVFTTCDIAERRSRCRHRRSPRRARVAGPLAPASKCRSGPRSTEPRATRNDAPRRPRATAPRRKSAAWCATGLRQAGREDSVSKPDKLLLSQPQRTLPRRVGRNAQHSMPLCCAVPIRAILAGR